jgi:hypothetical protein
LCGQEGILELYERRNPPSQRLVNTQVALKFLTSARWLAQGVDDCGERSADLADHIGDVNFEWRKGGGGQFVAHRLDRSRIRKACQLLGEYFRETTSE